MVRALLAAALLAAVALPARAATCERDVGAWRVIGCPKRGATAGDYGDVARRELPGGGPNVAVFFGGWSARDLYVRAWLDAVVASGALAGLRIGRLYALPGPFDSMWGTRREVPWQVVAGEIGGLRNPRLVLVAAHSSGAFVADTFVAGLGKAHPELLPRTALFKLDGGTLGELSALYPKLGALACVSAAKLDPRTHALKLGARNYCGMSIAQPPEKACAGATHNCGSNFAGKATSIVIDASATACTKANCLHDAVINTAPYDAGNFDLADDYAKFDGKHRPVVEWIAKTAALKRLAAP